MVVVVVVVVVVVFVPRRARPDERRVLEARGSLLGFQSGHQTVEGLDIVERSATTLIVVPLELHQLEVLVQRLQVGQAFLQALRRVGEPREIADSVGIDHVRGLHHSHVGGPGDVGQLIASVVELRWEYDRVAATAAHGRAATAAVAAAAAAGSCVRGAAADHRRRRSNIHGAQTVLRVHQVMMMRWLGFLDLVYVRE